MTGKIFEQVRRESTTQVPTYLDVQPSVLYDSVRISKYQKRQSRSYELFRVPVNETKTLADTNMCLSGELPAPQAFSIRRVGILFSPTCEPQDRAVFAENYCLDLIIGMKMYRRLPIALSFAVGEPSQETKYAESPPLGFAQLEEVPLTIEPQQFFGVNLIGTPVELTDSMKVWAVLFGLHARPVQ